MSAVAISTVMWEESLYATMPSLTAGHTCVQNQGFGLTTLKPGIERSTLGMVVLHLEIE